MSGTGDILIRGMEMPESCYECRFFVDTWCYAFKAEDWRNAYNKPAKGKRLNNCPLAPAADVRPVIRARWENNHCSACGMMPMGEELWEGCDFDPPKFEWFMAYCPNCGAMMEES